MPIEVRTKKIVAGNMECRLVQGVKALGRDRLPDHYLRTYPHCFLAEGGNAIIIKHASVLPSGHVTTVLKADTVYSEGEFQRMLRLLSMCGDRLMEVNKERARLEAEWKGQETFVI